jgi:hypothetical protein
VLFIISSLSKKYTCSLTSSYYQFSLDIEGAELPVLKTIPWDKVLNYIFMVNSIQYYHPVDSSTSTYICFLRGSL